MLPMFHIKLNIPYGLYRPLDKEFGMFLGIPGSGPATIVFTPSSPEKAPTAIVVNEQGSSLPDLPVPSGVGKRERVEVDPKKWTPLMLLYDEDVKNIELNGGIQFYTEDLKSPDKNTVLVPHRTSQASILPLMSFPLKR
ncbi:unnamed protein product [Dibothriocephalus latus]|uniref:Uncharacterized protein n=1 Tax=Dibothriocephalus latus TaxID=60516 RepID=A0A3P6PEY4_DIBLA|nr:unnamed protein product [Dibothriocephalus latus]